MANLMLHCGAQLADPILVAACPTPEPTNTWQPIPHTRLLDKKRCRIPYFCR